ncbi:MAG TPA: helix-turn-helix transcriptional regulator [Vicinamibacteria bacterium]|jgi:transcriptional regulator with XRE-family HTH domain
MKRARQLNLWPTARVAADELFDGRRVLGAHLRTARTRRHLTQEALAERIGIHPGYLGSIERGRRNVPLDMLCRLAWALRVDPHELLRPLPEKRRASASRRASSRS